MEASNEILWLIAGVILVTLEFTMIPGVGMLFAGVAALLVGVLTETIGISFTYQCVIFLAATILFIVLLYKPLRNYQSTKDANYSNMIGETATVIGTLTPGQTGQVKWSGTIMKAKLQSASGTLSEGQQVTITAVEGNILTVTQA